MSSTKASQPRSTFTMAMGCLIAASLGIGPADQAAAQDLQIAELGTCSLESGELIEDCRLGYRTLGERNPEGTNAVLLTTWWGGTSEEKLSNQNYVGPEGWVDPARYFVIVVDAFGNGVSSSPSNSRTQPGTAFPKFTMRDMVRAQHRLLTEELELDRLHAVVGASMGGMQAFQWVVSYPGAVARAVAVVGSPQLTSYDLLFWETMLRGIEASQACEHCDPVGIHAPLFFLALRTPEYRIRQTSVEEFPAFLKAITDFFRADFQSQDVKSQIRAILAHDVAAVDGGSLEHAAARVSTDMLIILATRDYIVRPEPALAFAQQIDAQVVAHDSDCGHLVYLEACAGAEIAAAIRDFLEGER
jgi:homoserine O-acetyltransferase/O-succinyltransferase